MYQNGKSTDTVQILSTSGTEQSQTQENPVLTSVWAQLTLQLSYWMLPPAVCVGPELSDSTSDRTNTHTRVSFSLSEALGLNLFTFAILRYLLSDFME